MPSPCAHSMSSALQKPPSARWRPGKWPVVRAQSFQHRPHQAAIGAGIVDLDRDHDLLAGRTRHLHVVGRAEAAIGHLHDPRLRVRGGGARLLRLLAVAALFVALLALPLDLGERRLRRLAPARCARAPLAPWRPGCADCWHPDRASTSRLSSSTTACASASCRSSVASRRNEPAPALARIRTPSCASVSRSTRPASASAARCSPSSRSSRSAQPTRKSASV